MAMDEIEINRWTRSPEDGSVEGMSTYTDGTSPVNDARPTVEILRYTAFTHDPTGGNPAGVVLDARGLDDATMLAIAARVGYSETAFVTSRDETNRRFGVRYFSPLAEVAFCGHATVALAVALAERTGPGEIVLDTPAGEIPVATASQDGAVLATLTSVATRSRPAESSELDAALKALGWEAGDLDPTLPPHVAFGGYLRTLGLVTAPTRIGIRQGEDMGRPSDLLIDVDPGSTRTRVTGQAVAID